MSQSQNYRLRPVGKRTQVVDAKSGHVIGSIIGSDATAYEARAPHRGRLDTAQPLTTVEAAATLLYLEFLFHLDDPKFGFGSRAIQGGAS